MSLKRFADIGRFPNETIDGETVLIDSEKGHLFLFTGIGPQVWQSLTTGAVVESLVDEVTARYGAPAAEPTRAFITALEQAGMLRNEPVPGMASAPTTPPGWPAGFEAPTLERYDQIADIISMDPIHEVDPGKGWPHRPGDKA